MGDAHHVGEEARRVDTRLDLGDQARGVVGVDRRNARHTRGLRGHITVGEGDVHRREAGGGVEHEMLPRVAGDVDVAVLRVHVDAELLTEYGGCE